MTQTDDLVEAIKSGPHWRFVFRPRPYVESRLQLEDCLPAVSKATVRFRGWDFPHQNPHKRPVMGTNFVASHDDFMGHLEYWRAYTSGQLIYLSSVREESEPGWRERLEAGARKRMITPSHISDWSSVPGFIELQNFVYTVTEFFEFSARYGQAMPRTDSVTLTVGLHNIAGFVLTVDDLRRGWWEYYAADMFDLESSWPIPLPTLVGSSGELALQAMQWLLVRFGWTHPNMDAIKADMDQLTQHGR